MNPPSKRELISMTRTDLIGVAAALAFGAICWPAAQSLDARQQLMRYLDGIAHVRLEERALAIGRDPHPRRCRTATGDGA
jgi:hypothetical protein